MRASYEEGSDWLSRMTTRVLVVDDTSLFRRTISDALTGIQDVEVVGTASNGKLALARIAALRPISPKCAV